MWYYVAQKERENTRQRQAQGIAAAKQRGVKWGKKPKPFPPDFDDLFRKWRRGEITNAEMARRCNMDISSVYRRLRKASWLFSLCKRRFSRPSSSRCAIKFVTSTDLALIAHRNRTFFHELENAIVPPLENNA